MVEGGCGMMPPLRQYTCDPFIAFQWETSPQLRNAPRNVSVETFSFRVPSRPATLPFNESRLCRRRASPHPLAPGRPMSGLRTGTENRRPR